MPRYKNIMKFGPKFPDLFGVLLGVEAKKPPKKAELFARQRGSG
jgi:hypothetical protein